jgi:hypothetical protein
MSDPVRIQYHWNQENVEKLFEASYRYSFQHSARRYIGWFFVALLQFGIVALLKAGAPAMMMFSSLALLYWYPGRKWLARRRTLKAWEDSPYRDQMIRVLADEDGLEIQSEEKGMHFEWDEIDAVLGLGEDVLLLREPHLHYIPSNAFGSIEAKSRFKHLAKTHERLRG